MVTVVRSHKTLGTSFSSASLACLLTTNTALMTSSLFGLLRNVWS